MSWASIRETEIYARDVTVGRRRKIVHEKPNLATETFQFAGRQTCYLPPVVHCWIFTLEDNSLFIFQPSCYYNNVFVHLHLTSLGFCFEIIVRDKIHASKIHEVMFYSFVRLEVFLLYLLNIVICSLKYLFIKKTKISQNEDANYYRIRQVWK